MGITKTAVHRPVAISILFALLMGMAAFMVPKIPVELFPRMTMPVIMISTEYPGAGPEEIEKNITKPLEEQLSNVAGLKKMTSVSSEGNSFINMEFDYSKNLTIATNDVRDSLEMATGLLPKGSSRPNLFKMKSTDMPVMTMIIQGKNDQNALKSVADKTIKPLLTRIQGVASVQVNGGQSQIVEVAVSENRLEAYNLSLSALSDSLMSQNFQQGSGSIQDGKRKYLLRTNAAFESVEQIKDVVIANPLSDEGEGVFPIKLKDIADISLAYEKVSNYVYVNGRPGITLSVKKKSGANSISVSKKIKGSFSEIEQKLPKGVSIEVLIDESTSIKNTMNQTYMSLLQGVALAMVVLFLFLRSWSSTIIIALSIPISIFITILFMKFAGQTINLMTLTGIILGLGMVVDCSIVILENIFRYRERGTKLETAAELGSKEMVLSISASTLTTICVFIPIVLFADGLGMFGQIFKSLAFTIVIALFISLFVAITLVPSLAANGLKVYTRTQKPLKNKILRKIDNGFEFFFIKLDHGYKKALYGVLHHRKKFIFLILLILGFSAQEAKKMGLVVAPEMESNYVYATMTLPQGTPLEETAFEMSQLSSLIEENTKGIKNLTLTIGEGGMASNKGSIEITLPKAKDQQSTAKEINELILKHKNDFPAAEIFLEGANQGLGSARPINVSFQSADIDAVSKTANTFKKLLETNIPQIIEPKIDQQDGLPQIEVKIDRERAYSFGVSMNAIGQEISANIQGSKATQYRLKGNDISVKVILQDSDRNSIPDLNKVFILNNRGEKIAISNVAHFEKTTGPVAINRENQRRTIHVTAKTTEGYDTLQAEKDIQKLIKDKMLIPDNVSYNLKGDVENLQAQGKQMIIIGIVALLLVFGVMAAQFESLKDPFIIFLTIPLMVIGVVLIYRLSGKTFSIISVVGLVVLVGLVVNSGIVLVDYTNLLLKRGIPLMDACANAAESRLRPILMTTFTTILGMLPLAFFGGEGTEQVQPIAQTIVGGLCSSSLMTLFMTPVLFYIFNKKKYGQRSPKNKPIITKEITK